LQASKRLLACLISLLDERCCFYPCFVTAGIQVIVGLPDNSFQWHGATCHIMNISQHTKRLLLHVVSVFAGIQVAARCWLDGSFILEHCSNSFTNNFPAGTQVIVGLPDNSFQWLGRTYHIGPSSIEQDQDCLFFNFVFLMFHTAGTP
jgi:hypothetical protein